MKRLFPVNEALSARHAAVLKIIAADLGCPADAVHTGNGESGPAVFQQDRQGSEDTRCACDLCSRTGRSARPGQPWRRYW